ncbi:hypothetical protein MJO28_010036, partial [Puccinia striiformis f. sp. tritici]
ARRIKNTDSSLNTMTWDIGIPARENVVYIMNYESLFKRVSLHCFPFTIEQKLMLENLTLDE